ncbi:MAG: enoyl-CoA hydratase-related protein, partial [Candidatus Nanopelagicales bacterium]
AITPTRLGIPYNTEGIAHFLSALPVHVVKEMFFTADPIEASRAWQLGIVNELVDDYQELSAACERWAQRIATRAPLAIQAIKAEISTLSDARHLTSNEFERLNALRTRAWMSADYREGLAAFHERRDPKFQGR